MGFPFLLKYFLAVIFFELFYGSIAQNDPGSPNRSERDALYALKASFDNPFLNGNWSGPPCDPLRKWYGIECLSGRVTKISLEGRKLKGIVDSNAFLALTELTDLSFKKNSLSGNTMNFSSNQKMKQIDLSGNKFHGPISDSLLSLSFLESLQLQDNNLIGAVPAFNQSRLIFFNVSDNNLQGQIPNTSTLLSFGSESFLNNPGLCGLPSQIVCDSSGNPASNDTADTNGNPPDPQNSSSKSEIPIWFLLLDIAGVVAIFVLFILYFRKAREARELEKLLRKEDKEEQKKDYGGIEEDLDNTKSSLNVEPRETSMDEARGKAIVVVAEPKESLVFMVDEARFELSDLLKASAEGLGKGIFGNSYKAFIEGSSAIVVKRLRDLKPLSNEEFAKQLSVIGDQKHPNLLPLLAYFYSKDEKLLVYKYAEKGNLSNRIHGGRGTKDRIPFRWSARLSVARAVARALEYLHLNNNLQIIVPHGNLKSSNVLFDENDMVLLSDYGLNSLIAQPIAAQRMVSYKSPEYQSAKKVSKKSDVWSYGCLLLELLTGRVSVHSAPAGVSGAADLSSWVHRAVREEWTAEIFDLEISVQRSTAAGMLKLLQIAMRCCEKYPEQRPEMTEVVREVENIKIVESSEDEEDLSMDRSLTDESLSSSKSGIMDDERSNIDGAFDSLPNYLLKSDKSE